MEKGVQMKFLDLQRQYQEQKKEFDAAYRRVMKSGRYVGGYEVKAFEEEWAEFCGAKYAVGVSSGQMALYLALMAFEIGPGDEVIVPAHTYIATWQAVTQTGATIVPIEPDETTMNIEVARVKDKVTEATEMVIPVHLYGLPVDRQQMREIGHSGKKHGFKVMYDCAQAHGAKNIDGNIGKQGLACAFSFYPAKNLGAFGDAGAVTTNIDWIAERLRKLRNHGSTMKYRHQTFGVNARLDPLQAAFLRVKLGRLNIMNIKRRQIAEYYLRRLNEVPNLRLPYDPGENTKAVGHQFVIRHPSREGLRMHLALNGIPTLIHYPQPPHLSETYKDLGFGYGDFPITERIADTCLSLPIDPFMTDDDVIQVIRAIKTF
jgi:dTDP-4-amino-4,6-dideoxygalactose transaminase